MRNNWSTGWEAIQFGKPVVVIGEPYYSAWKEGLVHCPDLSRLPEAIHGVLNLRPVNEERLLLFIAAILDQSFDFPLKLREGVVTEKTVRRHPEIVSTICDRLLAILDSNKVNP